MSDSIDIPSLVELVSELRETGHITQVADDRLTVALGGHVELGSALESVEEPAAAPKVWVEMDLMDAQIWAWEARSPRLRQVCQDALKRAGK